MELQWALVWVQLKQMSFFVFMKENGLNNALLNLNQFFVEDMFMIFLFYSNQPIISKNFETILILVTEYVLLIRERKSDKISFLDVEISRQNSKFVTTVYRKPNFSGVYTHYESFIPSIHKFGMLYTLWYIDVFLCAQIGQTFTEKF